MQTGFYRGGLGVAVRVRAEQIAVAQRLRARWAAQWPEIHNYLTRLMNGAPCKPVS